MSPSDGPSPADRPAPAALGGRERALLTEAVREAARAAILPRFRALDPSEISTKSGPADLVTLADTEAEALIQARVAAGWPEATVIGEESVAADRALRAVMGTADPCVVVDPVDGTWNFAKGLAVFGVLVAVLRAGKPVWGLLYDPVMDDWIEAAPGEPTRFVAARGARPLRGSAEARAGRLTGYMPLGLSKLATVWSAAWPDYALPGTSEATGYVLAAIVGVAITAGLLVLLGRLLTRSSPPGPA